MKRLFNWSGLGALAAVSVLAAVALPSPVQAQAPGQKPDIVVIWGDDIGITNVSDYSNGLMGFRTPNIGRVAHDGMIFTDYYGEQSCTAGRAAFNGRALGTFSSGSR
jgi:Sulfatase